MSPEIDAYPVNAEEWERAEGREASEEINGVLGYMSQFHDTHGFYVDGVDAGTAMLPEDWRSRAHLRMVPTRTGHVRVTAPSLEDLAISKLCRSDPKDMNFVRDLSDRGAVDIGTIRNRLRRMSVPDERLTLIDAFLDALQRPE